MSLTAAPEGWHGHLHRRRPSGDLPRSPPHHRELSRLRGLPPAPSSPGEVGLSAWLTPRSRRVAVLRADGIKQASSHRRFFYLPFFRRTLPNQRLHRTRPSVPAPPGRATPSICIYMAPPAVIPSSVALPADLSGPSPWPHRPPFFSSPIRLPPRPRPKVGTPPPPKYLSSCHAFRPWPPQVKSRVQHLTACRPWHQPMAAAYPGTGGSSAWWLPTEGHQFVQQKWGGSISRKSDIPREDVLTSTRRYTKTNLWRVIHGN